MKIKALIITAALVVGHVATSMAAVYSANAVGYVNVTVPNGKTILANPLNNGDNHMDTILPLDDTAAGMLVFRFDPNTQNYGDGMTFAGSALGWVNVNTFDKTPPELFIVPPGEGLFVQSLLQLDVTFVGDVPQGDLQNPVVGGNNRNLLASQVPQEAGLGAVGQDGTLEFIAGTGDLAFQWDDGTQNFKPGETYVDGLGWVDLENFTPINPDPVSGVGRGTPLPVGRGVFIQKTGEMVQSWNRTFSVNEP